jgi:hypothetical protein
MRYTIIVTIWIAIILYSKSENQTTIIACAVVHLLGMIGDTINDLVKQNKDSAEATLRSNESIALDLLKERYKK